MERSAADIAQSLREAFPDPSIRPSNEQVELVMRPMAPESFLLRRHIRDLFDHRHEAAYPLDHWMEANLVVSGMGEEHARAVQFLLMDTCTCVLDFLPEAVRHATQEVDARVLALLKHA